MGKAWHPLFNWRQKHYPNINSFFLHLVSHLLSLSEWLLMQPQQQHVNWAHMVSRRAQARHGNCCKNISFENLWSYCTLELSCPANDWHVQPLDSAQTAAKAAKMEMVKENMQLKKLGRTECLYQCQRKCKTATNEFNDTNANLEHQVDKDTASDTTMSSEIQQFCSFKKLFVWLPDVQKILTMVH